MSAEHKELITRFYTAFANKDAEAMVACYADDVVFEDPAFGELKGDDAKNMWRMLVERGGDSLTVTFKDVKTSGFIGSAYWEAQYPFGKTRRPVHNKIQATFAFKDGLIVRHKDKFNMYRWTRQALGATGTLLGWTPLVRGKVRSMARKGLADYTAKRNADAGNE
ncbi:MAG: nuclear transport factor 2 family protein [Bacteroidota bacterium]